MKSRWKRLNLNVNKWVGFYSKVISQPPASGTNIEDDIEAAQKLYRLENNGNDFVDFNVYHNIMSKHPKWSLPKKGVISEVSESSSKRTRSNMDSSPHSINIQTTSSVNVDTPTSVEDINNRPKGREAAKRRKGKTKTTTTTTESTFNEEDKSLLNGISTDNKAQIQLRQRRIEADLQIAEMTRENIKMKSDMKILNTLLAKQHLIPDEEEMKKKLIQKYMSDL
ncbi:hypothetical protein RND81_08G052100 [Saponaria officinalis]|uniref:No apical meristem-associated C-terminal domain-containing protein n=1 Tax=Saponaria officinalis TaxID=3572 RepID=A0AAW1J4H9_SAPOF